MFLICASERRILEKLPLALEEESPLPSPPRSSLPASFAPESVQPCPPLGRGLLQPPPAPEESREGTDPLPKAQGGRRGSGRFAWPLERALPGCGPCAGQPPSGPQTRTCHDSRGGLQGPKGALPSAALQALHAVEVAHLLQESKGSSRHSPGGRAVGEKASPPRLCCSAAPRAVLKEEDGDHPLCQASTSPASAVHAVSTEKRGHTLDRVLWVVSLRGRVWLTPHNSAPHPPLGGWQENHSSSPPPPRPASLQPLTMKPHCGSKAKVPQTKRWVLLANSRIRTKLWHSACGREDHPHQHPLLVPPGLPGPQALSSMSPPPREVPERLHWGQGGSCPVLLGGNPWPWEGRKEGGLLGEVAALPGLSGSSSSLAGEAHSPAPRGSLPLSFLL